MILCRGLYAAKRDVARKDACTLSITHNGANDVFATKLNATGTALAYSTFLGGVGDDFGGDIAVDAVGSAYLTGATLFSSAPAYPTTVGAFDTSPNGGFDVFVTKLNLTGSALTYSTLLGGSSNDIGNSIVVDAVGNAFLTGTTPNGATPFPTTTGAFDTTHNLGTDIFATKLNTVGSALTYSTFLGGTGDDVSFAITTDVAGNIYLTGYSAALNFPTSPEAFQSANNGGFDAFITKFGDFSISGRVVDQTGMPIANTATAMSGSLDDFMLTDSQGYFGFEDTMVGSEFIVAATHLSYNFTPNIFQFNNFFANRRVVFLGRPIISGPTAAIALLGGDVTSTAGNVPLPNTRLTLIDGVSGIIREVTTDAQGNYRFQNVVTGRFYLISAEREGYNFNPDTYAVVHLDENLNLDFTARPNSPRPVNDFDGDGKSDLAIYRPSEGNWYILESQNNNLRVVHFGLSGDSVLR